jgi:FkbM family methyltransferase
MNWLKRTLRRGVPWLLRVLPPGPAGWLIEWRPHWASLLPERKRLKLRQYLGQFSVVVDTLYPIEREMLSGIYDEGTVKIIRKYVRSGDVCFDVGANVGAITLALAQATGAPGQVHAFEPGPATFARLETNLALNPELKTTVHVHQLGVSDRPGFLKWREDMNNRGNANLRGPEGTEVSVTTLDDFCRDHRMSRVDFIKVDVEGMEYEVIKGAETALRTFRPILYFETVQPFVAIRGFDIFGETERMLKQCGYALFKVDESANTKSTTSADLSENTLALPVEFDRR